MGSARVLCQHGGSKGSSCWLVIMISPPPCFRRGKPLRRALKPSHWTWFQEGEEKKREQKGVANPKREERVFSLFFRACVTLLLFILHFPPFPFAAAVTLIFQGNREFSPKLLPPPSPKKRKKKYVKSLFGFRSFSFFFEVCLSVCPSFGAAAVFLVSCLEVSRCSKVGKVASPSLGGG